MTAAGFRFHRLVLDDLVKSHRNDGFVKSSPATGGTSA
jgi:hypothetical protein